MFKLWDYWINPDKVCHIQIMKDVRKIIVSFHNDSKITWFDVTDSHFEHFDTILNEYFNEVDKNFEDVLQ